VLIGGALAATFLTQGNSASADTTTSNNMITYKAGHRPLAPAVTGRSLTGSTISLSSYRGKTLVLNFWGSWCAPCRGEGPTFAELDQAYGPKGVAFLGDDVADTPTNALAFMTGEKITYPSFNDNGYLVTADFTDVGIKVADTPTTVVIDPTGHVVGMILGAALYSQVSTLINDAAVNQ
jgi:thiol-disulfide isomerase/thioredoxin